MIKVTIKGPGSRLVGGIIRKALEAAGISVNYWRNVTPQEVASCRREASRKGVEVSVVAMRAGDR